MKKIFTLILISVLACSITSCSITEKKQLKEIVLTKENFNDYFILNSYSDCYNECYHPEYMDNNYICSCTMNISVEKTCDFEINEPIDLRLDISSFDMWDSTSDEISQSSSHTMCITIPVTGNIYKTYPLYARSNDTMVHKTPTPSFRSVTGTIYITK